MQISMTDATNYIMDAFVEVGKNKNLRLGQALWNSLPVSVTNKLTADDADFFYERENSKVVKMFIDTMVLVEDN